MKLAGCVVLYNPCDEVFQNIESYSNLLDLLIVVDNSTKKNIQLIEKIKFYNKNKLCYIDNGGNLGIATALNKAADEAISKKYNWLLTMDQDSLFINFNHYIDCLKSIENKENIALLAANTTRDAKNKLPLKPTLKYEEKFSVITSANIINLNYFNDIGRFTDKLFIDLVDHEFCLKINNMKLKILYFKDVLVEHALGEVNLRKNILTGKMRYKVEHNAQRAYYITRNYLYVSKKYGKYFPKEINMLHVLNINFIHDITKILIYEPDKLNKIKAKVIALYHFIIGRYGKYDL